MWKASLIIVVLLLAGCAPEAVPGSGPTADLFMSAQYSKATAEAAQKESQYLGDQLTGTAAAPIVHITETAAAYQIHALETADAGTATAQSVVATGTAAAQATAAEEQSIASTSTAAATGTAGAWTATAVQGAVILADANRSAQQTAIANDTARNNLQLERQQQMNEFNAALPLIGLVVLIISLGSAGYLAFRRWSYLLMPRDARGDAVPFVNVIDGVVADMDKSFHPQLGLNRKDLLGLPAVTTAQQAPVTERDQLVDLATRGLPGSDSSARKRFAVSQMAAAGPALPDSQLVRFIGADEVAGILRPILPDVARDAMDAEVIRDNDED